MTGQDNKQLKADDSTRKSVLSGSKIGGITPRASMISKNASLRGSMFQKDYNPKVSMISNGLTPRASMIQKDLTPRGNMI